MTTFDFLQIALYMVVLLLLVKPVGSYMALVFSETPNRVTRVGAGTERLFYRLAGVHADEEMGWRKYAIAMLVFNMAGLLVVYGLQRLQQWLPLNPQHLPAVTADSSFNTAISFITNTNWQGYGGESTMSYLTQMLGLAVQNFLSAATGIAVLLAVIRGFTRRSANSLGNFWVDMTRSTLYVLLPMALVLTLALVSQGVVQNFKPYEDVPLMQSTTAVETVMDAAGNPTKDAAGNPVTKETKVETQSLPMGPAASQIAIKQLGTNGGGFFNVNSAHPYENPTPFSNFLEVLAILLIPASLCYTFGRLVGDRRQGWALLAVMTLIFVPLIIGCVSAEQAGNPALHAAGRGSASFCVAGRRQHGGQGDALRHCGVGHLGDCNNGSLERLGERDARFVHSAGRPGADVADTAWRGDLRWRGFGPVRHARLRGGGGIHRRPHGRTYARIPRQED